MALRDWEDNTGLHHFQWARRKYQNDQRPVLRQASDLAGLLTNLEPNDVLFIDKIHRLSPVVEDTSTPLRRITKLTSWLNRDRMRSVQIKLNPFTLIGATTRSGLPTSPLRARFGITRRLGILRCETLQKIVNALVKLLPRRNSRRCRFEIARSRGTRAFQQCSLTSRAWLCADKKQWHYWSGHFTYRSHSAECWRTWPWQNGQSNLSAIIDKFNRVPLSYNHCNSG